MRFSSLEGLEFDTSGLILFVLFKTRMLIGWQNLCEWGSVQQFALANLLLQRPLMAVEAYFALEVRSQLFYVLLKQPGMVYKKGEFLCLDIHEWENEIGLAPLNCRVWVLQERLLSPRTLHFGAFQLYWECEELHASEMYPQKYPTGGSESRFEEFWSLRKVVISDGFYRVWVVLVQEYSRCALTKESDKLVASSDAARLMSERLDREDTYLAGLWKSSLVEHSMWRKKSSSVARRSKVYRAPTWSWACLDAEVAIYDYGPSDNTMVNVLDAKVVTLADPFGQVNSGTIRVRDPLFRVKLKPNLKYGTSTELSFCMILSQMLSITLRTEIRLNEEILPSTDLDYNFHCLVFKSYLMKKGIGLMVLFFNHNRERQRPISAIWNVYTLVG